MTRIGERVKAAEERPRRLEANNARQGAPRDGSERTERRQETRRNLFGRRCGMARVEKGELEESVFAG